MPIQKIVEIRVHSKFGGKSEPYYITLIFDNHTQSLCDIPFRNRFEAEIFVNGLRGGFEWAKKGVLLDENS